MNLFKKVIRFFCELMAFFLKLTVGRFFSFDYRSHKLVPVNCKVCDIPVFVTDLDFLGEKIIIDIALLMEKSLKSSSLIFYKSKMSSIKKIVFTPAFSFGGRERAIRDGVVILSFDSSIYPFDFLVAFCVAILYKSETNRRHYKLFDVIQNKVLSDMVSFSKNDSRLFSDEKASLGLAIYENFIRRMPPLHFFIIKLFRLSSHKYWHAVREIEGQLNIYSLLISSRLSGQGFDRHFLSLYTELSKQSFFLKYKKSIEVAFRSIIICDSAFIFWDSLPFCKKEGGIFVLQFTYRYLTFPHAMIADLIFYSCVYNGLDDIDLAFQQANQLRSNFFQDYVTYIDNVN